MKPCEARDICRQALEATELLEDAIGVLAPEASKRFALRCLVRDLRGHLLDLGCDASPSSSDSHDD